VYDAARSVVDAMRHRSRIGETLALSALGRYLRRDGRSGVQYVLERFLYHLAASPLGREHFVLKGGLLPARFGYPLTTVIAEKLSAHGMQRPSHGHEPDLAGRPSLRDANPRPTHYETVSDRVVC
jgi:hypothetical protein